ncbi:MAG: extracellular solute-binding protein [Cypionkella sp.]|nr:extracellular solute-binding protein [Cypionkella sp.]
MLQSVRRRHRRPDAVGRILPGHQDDGRHAASTVDWADYFPGIANYYSSKSGEFFSMPWNSSTPVYYFNKDHFAKAGITEAPITWEGMEAAFNALKASSRTCALGLCALDLDRP